MSEKILNFIKYNNAFTIIFVVVFFGFSVTFAASEDVRASVYDSKETLVSVDNGLVLSTDLDNFNFSLRIDSVTDDEKNYYAAYSYDSMMIENGAWITKRLEKTLTISRESLGGRDLGLYIAEELGENINAELAYLKRVQKIEREKGESQKVVTVEYSGLVGKMLDPKDMVIEGYNPVIPEPVPEVTPTVTVKEQPPQEVIVSTPYTEPKKEPIIPAPSASSTTTVEVIAEPDNQALPEPEEMVNEELIQEVVEELIQTSSTTEPIIETPNEPTSSTTEEGINP